MKKWMGFLLVSLIWAGMAVLLAGCEGKEAAPLRICLDVEEKTMNSSTERTFQRILEDIEEEGGPAGVQVEYIPRDGVERETALTRLRTEVMAGEGPDLFLFSTSYWQGESVFPMPEKAMYNDLFLSLDPYIEKARFACWEDFNQAVLEAGRTEKGQMLVPLSYTFPVTCFRRTEAGHTPARDITWQDMLDGGDPVLEAAAILGGGGDNNLSTLGNPNFDGIFGQLADYAREELLFTGEELADCVQRQVRLYEEENGESTAQLPSYFQSYAYPGFFSRGDGMTQKNPIKTGEELTVIPAYSKNGGVTATVFHYACISASTKHGEEAFYVLDYLLRRDKDSYTQDFTDLFLFTNMNGLPIDTGAPLASIAYDQPISDENKAALDRAVDSVTAVNIHGKLNKMLAELYSRCEGIQLGAEEGDLAEQIQETYRVMQMELAES